MSLRAYILDGLGKSGRAARVDNNNSLQVASAGATIPLAGTANKERYLNSLLGSTGADSGTLNMNVDGSSTAQEFYIEASPDYDIRVMQIAIVIADTAIAHGNFGNVGALANGWTLKVTEAGADTSIIEAATTGGDLIAQSGFNGAYGDGTTSFELSNWAGTNDAQTVSIPMYQLIPNGLRIGQGTKDRITSVVNDNLIGLTTFNVRILGYKHYR